MKIEQVYFTQINENIEFLIGKNQQDNFNIIDMAKPTDLWFHLDDYPSCHVIAKVPEIINKKDLKYIIKRGALICKQHSNYKSIKDLNIIYTCIKNVKKTSIIGSVTTTNTKIICL